MWLLSKGASFRRHQTSRGESNILAFWGEITATTVRMTGHKKKNSTKHTLKRTSLCLWHDSIALVVWLGSECWSPRVQLQSTSCTSSSSTVNYLALLLACWGARWGREGGVSVGNAGLFCVRADVSKGTSATGWRVLVSSAAPPAGSSLIQAFKGKRQNSIPHDSQQTFQPLKRKFLFENP